MTAEPSESTPPAGGQTVSKREARWLVLLLLAVGMGVLYIGTQSDGRRGPPAGWYTGIEAARQEAAETAKPILINFGAGWCPACIEMNRNVFTQPEVQKALADFVTVHVDVDRQARTAEAFGVQFLPTMVVVTDKGKALARFEGGLNKEQFLQFLSSARGSASAD
jgi:thioredoxin-related protein